MDHLLLGQLADRPAGQQPDWPDPFELAAAKKELADRPPLVAATDVHRLRALLGRVARGRRTSSRPATAPRTRRSAPPGTPPARPRCSTCWPGG